MLPKIQTRNCHMYMADDFPREPLAQSTFWAWCFVFEPLMPLTWLTVNLSWASPLTDNFDQRRYPRLAINYVDGLSMPDIPTRKCWGSPGHGPGNQGSHKTVVGQARLR